MSNPAFYDNSSENSSSNTNRQKIACVGECMIELRASGPNQFASGFAGDTLNTAIYLARSGLLDVAFVSAVGRDAISDRMVDSWSQEGIDTSLVGRHDIRRPGLYMIENDEHGERTFHYWRSESAARTLFLPESNIDTEALACVDAIYVSGITMAIIDNGARRQLMEFLKRFRGNGGCVAYDSNYRPALWCSIDKARDVTSEMWSVATHAFPSVDDEMALFGDKNEEAVLRRLFANTTPELVLKRGHLGPRVFALNEEVLIANLSSAEKVVDTTGAGDSFNAGYLATRLAGGSMLQSAESAHNLALKVIAHPGAILS